MAIAERPQRIVNPYRRASFANQTESVGRVELNEIKFNKRKSASSRVVCWRSFACFGHAVWRSIVSVKCSQWWYTLEWAGVCSFPLSENGRRYENGNFLSRFSVCLLTGLWNVSPVRKWTLATYFNIEPNDEMKLFGNKVADEQIICSSALVCYFRTQKWREIQYDFCCVDW